MSTTVRLAPTHSWPMDLTGAHSLSVLNFFSIYLCPYNLTVHSSYDFYTYHSRGLLSLPLYTYIYTGFQRKFRISPTQSKLHSLISTIYPIYQIFTLTKVKASRRYTRKKKSKRLLPVQIHQPLFQEADFSFLHRFNIKDNLTHTQTDFN